MTALNGAVVLVTGANGGIGTHFVHDALARGASKVYATARKPRAWDDERIVPLALDVTDPASIQAAVEAAGDVTVLINNAGASPSSAGILTHTEAEIRTNVETNFLGPLFLARAFAPILAAKQDAAHHRHPLRAELVRRRRHLQRHQGGAVVGDELAAPGAPS